MRSVASILRSLGHTPSTAVAPATPTLAVVNVGDGDSVVASITGDGGATHTLYYWGVGDAGMTTGLSRVGDGDIVQTGLAPGAYRFIAVSDSAGVYSLPSNPADVVVCDLTTGGLMCPITQLAEDVADALNGGAFSMAFVAERVYVPELKLDELETLHVTVIPRQPEIAIQSRATNAELTLIEVAIQKRVSAEDLATLDNLMYLACEVRAFLTRRDMSGGLWKSSGNVPTYSVELLKEKRVFTSVIQVIYLITT